MTCNTTQYKIQIQTHDSLGICAIKSVVPLSSLIGIGFDFVNNSAGMLLVTAEANKAAWEDLFPAAPPFTRDVDDVLAVVLFFLSFVFGFKCDDFGFPRPRPTAPPFDVVSFFSDVRF